MINTVGPKVFHIASWSRYVSPMAGINHHLFCTISSLVGWWTECATAVPPGILYRPEHLTHQISQSRNSSNPGTSISLAPPTPQTRDSHPFSLSLNMPPHVPNRKAHAAARARVDLGPIPRHLAASEAFVRRTHVSTLLLVFHCYYFVVTRRQARVEATANDR